MAISKIKAILGSVVGGVSLIAAGLAIYESNSLSSLLCSLNGNCSDQVKVDEQQDDLPDQKRIVIAKVADMERAEAEGLCKNLTNRSSEENTISRDNPIFFRYQTEYVRSPETAYAACSRALIGSPDSNDIIHRQISSAIATKRYNLAEKLLLSLVEKGDIDAAGKLGKIYVSSDIFGSGKSHDGFTLLYLGVWNNHDYSIQTMFKYHYQGYCLPENFSVKNFETSAFRVDFKTYDKLKLYKKFPDTEITWNGNNSKIVNCYNRDPYKAFDLLINSARSKYIPSMYEVLHRYYSGSFYRGYISKKVVVKNLEQDYRKLVTSLYQLGDKEATYYYLKSIIWGYGYDKDIDKAVKIAENSSETIDPYISYDLARALDSTSKIKYRKKNDAKAKKFYEYSLLNDISSAFNSVGYQYVVGGIYQQNLTKGISYLEKAAKLGNVRAMINLGNYYRGWQEIGRRNLKGMDKKGAAFWYRKAANFGHKTALYWYAKEFETDPKNRIAFLQVLLSRPHITEKNKKRSMSLCLESVDKIEKKKLKIGNPDWYCHDPVNYDMSSFDNVSYE